MVLSYVEVLEDWGITPDNFKILDKKLGEGQFGIVRQGLLTTGKGDPEIVAVKTLKGADSYQFCCNLSLDDLSKRIFDCLTVIRL